MRRIIVLDKMEYKDKESQIEDMLGLSSDLDLIFYTEYEDEKIRRVRNNKYVGNAAYHILYWKKSFDYAKEIYRMHPQEVYSLNPLVGMFLGLLNKDNQIKINMGGFLFEPKKNKLYYALRKLITYNGLKGINKVMVYGKAEVDYYKNIFKNNEFVFVPYGIDFDNTQKYKKNELPEHYIFSGGGSNRDYETLINAYNLIKDNKMPLVVATQPWRIDKFDTTQVVVLDDVVLENFGDVLRKSQLLVLSLEDRNISAGHMVMFQAMSLNVPILVNDIPAIRDYVGDDAVTFFNSRDSNDLSRKLLEFENQKKIYSIKAKRAKQLYDSELNFMSFLNRFVSL